jgi:hypothetical protein
MSRTRQKTECIRKSKLKTYTKFDVGREECKFLTKLLGESGTASSISRNADIGGCNDALLAVQGAKDFGGEFSTSICHRESGRTGTILGLDDFITTELNAINQSIVGFLREARRKRVRRLRKEGNNLPKLSQLKVCTAYVVVRLTVTPL